MARKGKTSDKLSYPSTASEVSNLVRRVEPLLTPELLLSRHLKNIPGIADYTNEELKDQINIAMNKFEMLTNLTVDKTEIKESKPYDYALYKNFVHFQTERRPILSVQDIVIRSADKQNIYRLPDEWISSALFHKGQINVMPLLSILGTGTNTSAATTGNLFYIQALSNYRWLPSFFEITYTVGLCNEDGKVPMIVNSVIGIIASIEILKNIQSLNIYNSQSLSQDGISQSSSSAGPAIYQTRIEGLMQERDEMIKQIKRIYFSKYFITNI